MSTPAIPTPETQPDPKFDGAKFIEQQQAKHGPPPVPGQPPPRAQAAEQPKVQEAAPVVEPDDEEEPPAAPKPGETEAQAQARNRRERRANQQERIAQLERDLAYERGLREGASKAAPKETAQPANASKTELKREDFKSEAEYIRAVAKEVAAEELAATSKEQEALDEIRADIEAAKAAFPEHVKLIADWHKVDEKLKTLHFKGIPDATGVEQYSYFFQLWSRSPYRAFVSEYFANHPDEFASLRDQEADRRDIAGMTARFHRLEGRMEAVYNQRQEAARAADPEKGKKESQRTDPGNAEQARAAAADDGKETIRLPKPSSEVSAKGGSAHANGDVNVKDNPAAWIQRRQELAKGR